MSIGLAIGTHLGRVGGAAIAYLHRSTFTAPDGTALTAYTPEVGGSWTGTAVINGGQASGSSSGYCITDAGVSDVTVDADVTMPAVNAAPAILLRYLSANDNWFIELYKFGSTVSLYEYVGGARTTRAQLSIAIPTGQHHIKARLSGTTIQVWFNGTPLPNYTNASSGVTRTKFGFQTHDPGDLYDNFTITAA